MRCVLIGFNGLVTMITFPHFGDVMAVFGFEFPETNYIAGKWQKGSTESFSVLNKFTQQELSQVNYWNDTEQVIEASLACKKYLDTLSAGKKRELLESFLTEFKKRTLQLTELVVAEAGKPLKYAQLEVLRCQSTLQDSIEECTRIKGEVVPMDFSIGEGKSAFTKLKGAGVVLAISPFNFPLNLALHKIAPAVAAGCPVILRPSPHTPLCALALAEIAQKAKWPQGLLQVINTPVAETQSLVEDRRLRILSFTGSDRVGWMLRDMAHEKNVILELGGNAAIYIDERVELSGLAKKLISAAFLFAGQICISTQRVYVHKDLYLQLEQELLEEMKHVKTGDPALEENLYGPVIDQVALERIHQWVKEDVSAGAKLLCGGEILDREKRVYAPTILTHSSRTMHIHKDEFFAPVMLIEKVSDAEEAFERINDSKYGLQAGVFSQNIEVINKAFQTLEVGAVIINNVPGFRIDSMPYGGMKSSGLGREGARYSIEAYSEKTLCVM